MYIIKFDYPSKLLVSVFAYVEYHSLVVINSLRFKNNKRTHGPFGAERGEFFHFPSIDGNKITGFRGGFLYHLDYIGTYYELSSQL